MNIAPKNGRGARGVTELLHTAPAASPLTDESELAIASHDDEPHAPPSAPPLAIDVALLDTPPIRSYSTGNLELDGLIGGGVATRQMLTLLGPPGAGKSAWAIATALYIAPTLPVLYCSTELEQHELMARIAGNILETSWSAIARGKVPRQVVVDALTGVRIRLIGSEVLPPDGGKALAMIEREASTIAKLYDVPPLVVIDYLQDLARGSDRDLRSRTGDLASSVRAMAQRLDCPLIAVGSVGRAYYNPRRAQEMREADDPAIYLAAAKESGDVDYASAVVIFVDVEDDRDNPERKARIAVAKSRHGQVGFAGASFAGASGRWLPAPDAVSAMSSPGRAERAAGGKLDDADKAVLEAVIKQHREGKRSLCTKSQLRLACGIATGRVPAALERLVHVGRLRLAVIDREEGGKVKKREIYEPVAVEVALPTSPEKPLELALEQPSAGLHGSTPVIGSARLRVIHADTRRRTGSGSVSPPLRGVDGSGQDSDLIRSERVRTDQNGSADLEAEETPWG